MKLLRRFAGEGGAAMPETNFWIHEPRLDHLHLPESLHCRDTLATRRRRRAEKH
jgi:hypothetical protein